MAQTLKNKEKKGKSDNPRTKLWRFTETGDTFCA